MPPAPLALQVDCSLTEAPVDDGHSKSIDPSPALPVVSMMSYAIRKAIHHVKKHAGMGIVCAVAYFDPYVFRTLIYSWFIICA